MLRFTGFEVYQYGSLDYTKYGSANFPLFAAKSSNWDPKRPMILVTGGVHGYETSGVHGALLFLKKHMIASSELVNVLVLPCISPWGYETINRWNPEAIDPNRSFKPATPGCGEAAAAMTTIKAHADQSSFVLMHTDLHETTDTDNSEFIPAKTARDGSATPEWDPIPDGFYLVANGERPVPGWHAISVNYVYGRPHVLLLEDGTPRAVGLNEFSAYRRFEPVARLGGSTWLYHLTAEDITGWLLGR